MYGNIEIRRLVTQVEASDPSVAEIIKFGTNTLKGNHVFYTPSEYLNSMIKNRVVNDIELDELSIHRRFSVMGYAVHVELCKYRVNVSVYSDSRWIKYKYMTEGLLLHMMSITKRAPNPRKSHVRQCCYKHFRYSLVFDEHLILLTCIAIDGTIKLELIKYGNSIDELITKCASLLAAIYDNYIEPIGLANLTRDNMRIVEMMLDNESLVMPKSALN